MSENGLYENRSRNFDSKEYSLSMKEIPICDRPYEKLEKSGERTLTDTELLAIIIKNGRKGMSAMDISRIILKDDGNKRGISMLCRKPVEDLMKIPGIGKVKAISIKAAIELGRRSLREYPDEGKTVIQSPSDVVRYFKEEMEQLTCEEMKIVLLDSKNVIMKVITHTGGTVNEILFSPRSIFKDALKYDAASIILVHNHPSGCIVPSSSDIDTTKAVMKIGNELGVGVLDHIVVGKQGYQSIRSVISG